MSAPLLLDGKSLALKIRSGLKERVERIVSSGRAAPVLATILVGEDPASATYVNMKGRACEAIGVQSRKIRLGENIGQEELLATIAALNQDAQVSGILLQHPIPSHLNERQAFDLIEPAKDVDGVTALGFGLVSMGEQAFACCTPGGIIRLLDEYELPMAGKQAVVLGRSPILGKPMAMMLLNRHATVTICHSRTVDLPGFVKQADIVVAAVGRPEFVKGEWIKPGAVVIDAGYNQGNVGDCHFESCAKNASAITPVPGGVGPMTIAMLLENTVTSAEKTV